MKISTTLKAFARPVSNLARTKFLRTLNGADLLGMQYAWIIHESVQAIEPLRLLTYLIKSYSFILTSYS